MQPRQLGFGGPIALVGYMQRDLVEDRRWYSEAEFAQALAVGQTMPGPLAVLPHNALGSVSACFPTSSARLLN